MHFQTTCFHKFTVTERYINRNTKNESLSILLKLLAKPTSVVHFNSFGQTQQYSQQQLSSGILLRAVCVNFHILMLVSELHSPIFAKTKKERFVRKYSTQKMD